MGEDSTITIGLAIALVAGLVTLLEYIRREIAAVTAKIEQEQRWREEADEEERRAREQTALNDQNGRMIIQRELSDYKLYVAQNHVTAASLRETEDRLIAALDKLTARLETVVSRIEALSAEMARFALPKGRGAT